MPKLIQFITKRRESIILALMLILLHLSIMLDFGSPLSRSLFLVHLGLFLIWQPFQRSDKPMVWYNSIIFTVLPLLLVYWANWGLISAWLIILIGIVGGRVVTVRIERNIYMLVMIFLVSELLTTCIPSLFDIAPTEDVYDLLEHGIAIIPFVLLFFPAIETKHTERSVDFLHAITAALLTSLLALGSLILMYHNNTDYFVALIQTLLAIGVCLLAISWLLTPRSGFSGLSELWTKSLLNIGTPFELWLFELSQLRQEHQSADLFLQAAMEKLVALPWMAGVAWTIEETAHSSGSTSKHKIKTTVQEHPVTLYTNVHIGGALLLHCNLLIQLIDNFYIAKINERDLAKQAHLQAIYETGARITHDIKNLLQAMHSMVSILQTDTGDNKGSNSIALLKKQFPYFIQRLELAISKLQAPKETSHETVSLKDWWQELQTRYRDFSIEFNKTIESDPYIPVDLFNSVAENLLENAIEKKKNEPDIKIKTTIIAKDSVISLIMNDTGSAINEETTKHLFKEPLNSDNGLGIGLYQAARQAESHEYSLELKNNIDGNVTFELLKGRD